MSVEILIAFSHYLHYTQIPTLEEIMTIPVWLNSAIRRADTPFMNWKLISSNINTLTDLWDEETDSPLTYEKMIERHGEVINFMTYSSLFYAIPSSWKSIMRQRDPSVDPLTKVERCKIKSLGSKLICWQLIEKWYPNTQSMLSCWHKDLHLSNYQEEISKDILDNFRKISSATKLRWLQYRIINRILTTNCSVAKWDKNQSPLCSFCFSHEETVLYIFWFCERIQSLWTKLTRWINHFVGIKPLFIAPMIIFNDYPGPQRDYINTLILIMKQFIYSSKCLEKELSFVSFVNTVDHWYNIEKLMLGKKVKSLLLIKNGMVITMLSSRSL